MRSEVCVRGFLAVALLMLVACGRTAVTRSQGSIAHDGGCALSVDPSAIDFGTVPLGARLDATVSLRNIGSATCQLAALQISSDSDAAFSLDGDYGTTQSIVSGGDVNVKVAFAPTDADAQGPQSGSLTFTSNDPAQPQVAVPLSATVARCAIEVSPLALDFGGTGPGVPVDRQLTVTNTGNGTCTLSSAMFVQGSDPGFTLPSDGFDTNTVAPGSQATLTVRFDATEAALPTARTGTLSFSTNDPLHVSVQVPLTVELQFCSLLISPNPFDFGNVVLNATVTDQLTLTNQGLAVCDITVIALTPNTDPGFSLPSPPVQLSVAPGEAVSIAVTFAGLESAPPHQRTGTLTFTSNDANTPNAAIPLSAFINTICTQAGQFIYTVDDQDDLSRFNPVNRTSQDIGVLHCPTSGGPFSMQVDQSAIAWVLYDDDHLYRVDTADASCTATAYSPDQHGLDVFGMGSVFNSNTGMDTVYIAGEAEAGDFDSTLATLNLSSFLVSPIGPINVGNVELAGTGDGQLWGFASAETSETDQPVLAQIDPLTGDSINVYDASGITSSGGFAMKFFGGAFYVFIGPDVWEVDRSTLVPGQFEPTSPPQLVFTNPGRDVVGAGVSTCAPVQ